MGYTAEDEALIREKWDDLLFSCTKICKNDEDWNFIKRAFFLAKEAHEGVRRRSGEPYLLHPIAVAKIVIDEIGLGVKSVVAALLHDVVEDTEYTVEDMERIFGPKIASMVDGLTKMAGVFNADTSEQAEYFRKVLLTLSDDVRVILIKICDRLHNMRTLGSMLPNKQFKIAGETLYIYAPLANRLGLYKIKTELENLSFKYEHPEEYQEIEEKLAATATERDKVFNDFTTPIRAQLDKMGLDVLIVGRGGGSMEDLWAFNTETVINAVYTCKTPIISAVGHETDFTITDFVADMRAPTPSAAAELAVPDREEELRRIAQLESIASRALRSLLERENQRLDSCLARRGSAGAYISTRLERLQALMNGNRQQIRLRLERENTRLERVLEQIEAYSPLAVLRRGYTLVRHTDGSPVTKKDELSPGTALRLQFADGSVPVQVLEEREDE